jgi:hypothetical protein
MREDEGGGGRPRFAERLSFQAGPRLACARYRRRMADPRDPSIRYSVLADLPCGWVLRVGCGGHGRRAGFRVAGLAARRGVGASAEGLVWRMRCAARAVGRRRRDLAARWDAGGQGNLDRDKTPVRPVTILDRWEG